MKSIAIISFILFFNSFAQAKEFCGLLNKVLIADSDKKEGPKKVSFVKIFNPDFEDAFITVKNEGLASAIANRITDEIFQRNGNIDDYGHPLGTDQSDKTSHPRLKKLRARKKDGVYVYANWYYKQSLIKYSFCVDLHSSVKRSANAVNYIGNPTDKRLFAKFKTSINETNYIPPPPADIQIIKDREVNLLNQDSSPNAWFYEEIAERYCFTGDAKQIAKHLNDNDGEPFWYYDEGEFFVRATAKTDNVVRIDLRSDYDDYNTFAVILSCY